MPHMDLSIEGAHLVLQIRQHTYTLTAPLQVLSSDSIVVPKHLVFRYQDSYENAIDVGTLGELQEEIYHFLDRSHSQTNLEAFKKKWIDLQNTLARMPVLGNAIASVTNTDVRIVRIELDLTRQDDTNFTGKLRLGLAFTPSEQSAPRLFNVVVRSFGAVIGIDIAGNIQNDLGGWPA